MNEFGLILVLGFIVFWGAIYLYESKKSEKIKLKELEEKDEELKKIKDANDPNLFKENLNILQNKLTSKLIFVGIKPTKKLLSGEVVIRPRGYKDDTGLHNSLDDICQQIRDYRRRILGKNKRN